MKRVLVAGAGGRMGERVLHWLGAHEALQCGGALEASGHPKVGEDVAPGVTITDEAKAALEGVDAVIDFTVPGATLDLMGAAADAGVAYVTGTTGCSEEQRGAIAELATRIPVIHAPNFSVSVNVLAWLAREAARRLGEGFDAELFEIHHAGKRDAPSGTALLLARAVAEGQGKNLDEHLVLERAGETGARPAGAIGIQTLRGGDNPGEHTVYFAGAGERVELAHRSSTRDHFARGAVQAAAWLIGKPPGLYPIETVYGLD